MTKENNKENNKENPCVSCGTSREVEYRYDEAMLLCNHCDEVRKEVVGLKLLPCPFCNGCLILEEDHHGKWWEHENKFSSDCWEALIQVHDKDEANKWNKRPLTVETIADTLAPKWRNDFLTFVGSGECSQRFLTDMNNNIVLQKAVEDAFPMVSKDIDKIVRELQKKRMNR